MRGKGRPYVSPSLRHFDAMSLQLTLMNFDSISAAMALARYFLPVPGGPYNKTL